MIGQNAVECRWLGNCPTAPARLPSHFELRAAYFNPFVWRVSAGASLQDQAAMQEDQVRAPPADCRILAVLPFR